MRLRWSRSLLFTIAVATVFVLSACGSLPYSGPVHVSAGDLPPEGRSTQTAPLPRKGSQPLDVIRGFMAASAAGATNNDFDAARQYLLPEARQAWEPEKMVRVYANDQVPQLALQSERNEARLAIVSLGQLNKSGLFSAATSGGQLVGTFKFRKDAQGEWRIANLPDGITISRGTFEASYQRLPVYFLSTDRAVLVPDVRWIPKSRTVTYLTQYLLDGPAESLGSSVTTALPEGTTLPSRAVVVENGQAEVDLKVIDRVSSVQAQSMIQWQVGATLSQLPSVTSVKVTLNDQLVTVSPPSGPAFSGTEVLTVVANSIRTLNGDNVLLTAADAQTQNLRINSLAHGPVKGSPVAFLSGNSELWVIPEGQSPEQLLADRDLGAPTIDYDGWIWVSTDAEGALTAVKRDEPRIEVPVNYTRERLQRFVVSSDGTHAVAFRGGDSPSIDLVRINRDLNGRPKSIDLTSTYPLPAGVDAFPSWVSETSAAALVRDKSTGETNVWKLPLGGLLEQSPGYPLARAFAATMGTRRWFVITDENVLYQLDGRHWIPLAKDVTDVATSG